MKGVFTIILSTLAMFAIILLVAFLGGAIIWVLWPYTIPLIFPGLVSSGAIASSISLKTAVLFYWLTQCLFTSVNTSKK